MRLRARDDELTIERAEAADFHTERSGPALDRGLCRGTISRIMSIALAKFPRRLVCAPCLSFRLRNSSGCRRA